MLATARPLSAFTYQVMLDAPDHGAISHELESAVTHRLRASADAWDEVYVIIDELRALGHEMSQFDESPDDFQHWMGDPRSAHDHELVLSAFFYDGIAVEASFQRRNRG